MPRINHNQENADFMASVNQTLKKVQNKAKQSAKFYNECNNARHWQKEKEKAKQGLTHSELALWIV